MRLRRLPLTFFCVLACTCAARAQITNAGAARPGASAEHDDSTPQRREMLRELEIKREEHEHQESLGRAQESARLGQELRAHYEHAQTFGAAEWKKLNRVEKLARQVRSDSGGADDKSDLADPPRDMGAAIKRLAEAAAQLCKKVEQTPRQVVSAAVIERANEVIEVARYLRTFSKP